MSVFCLLPVKNGYAQNSDIQNKEVQTVLVANQQATFSSPLSAQIIKLDYHNGDLFEKGDVLIGFDCRKDRAALQEFRAGLTATKAKYEAQKKLQDLNSITEIELMATYADYQKARAAHDISATRVENCQLKAPYDGRITDRQVNLYETAKEGQELLSIASVEKPQAQMLVPSRWLSWLQIGTPLSLTVFETGEAYLAKIVRIGGAVDEISQSIMVVAEIEAPGKNILPGMSGTATFSHDGKTVSDTQ
ncbi:MAG: efflux RND transporter periplasmic adaptor subunit [Pseudomonadota bacterium]